jgi:hypothetical protein
VYLWIVRAIGVSFLLTDSLAQAQQSEKSCSHYVNNCRTACAKGDASSGGTCTDRCSQRFAQTRVPKPPLLSASARREKLLKLSINILSNISQFA